LRQRIRGSASQTPGVHINVVSSARLRDCIGTWVPPGGVAGALIRVATQTGMKTSA
jgi:hypothetical protein